MADKILLNCAFCDALFQRSANTIRKYRKKGRDYFYCCLSCASKAAGLKSATPRELRNCPVCDEEFQVKVTSRKKTCSYACSNKLFRSGSENGNWKKSSYQSTCFQYHEKKCVCCDERNIVAVHHFDENRQNNDPRNLVPMCPTHHQYIHSRYAYLVLPTVKAYLKQFKAAHKYVRFK